MIRLTRHPGERGFRRRDVAGCSACCCCCCLHTVGALVGAVHASRRKPAAPVHVAPRGTRSARSARPAAPPLPAAGSARHPEAQEVLALFVLFWIAEQGFRDGDLARDEFDGLSEALRARVFSVWERLFAGREASAHAWALARSEFLIDTGVLPGQAQKPLQQRIGPLAVGAERPPTGYLAHIWKLHTLYVHLDAVAAAGAVPAKVLDEVRAQLINQVMVAVAGLDPKRPADGRTTDRPFSDEVWHAAAGALDALEGRVPAEALTVLRTALPLCEVRLREQLTGTCRVCGDALGNWPVVHCAACATAHHRDCWQYNSGCATYACGSTDHDQAQGSAAPAAPRVTLHRPPVTEATPGARSSHTFWMIALVICSMTGLLTGTLGLDFVAFGPAHLAGAAVLALIYTGCHQGPGRGEQLRFLGRILGEIVLGCIAGIVTMCLPWIFSIFVR